MISKLVSLKYCLASAMAIVMISGLTSAPRHRARAADAPPPTAKADESLPKPDWKAVGEAVGVAGQLKDNVYAVTILRDDLDVTIEGMSIPAAAGLAHRFNFFQCPCGKIILVGEFCVPEYETNDVIDSLRAGALLRVGSASNLFVGDRPKIMSVHFQGEGDGIQMAKLIKDALRWTGEARNHKSPLP